MAQPEGVPRPPTLVASSTRRATVLFLFAPGRGAPREHFVDDGEGAFALVLCNPLLSGDIVREFLDGLVET